MPNPFRRSVPAGALVPVLLLCLSLTAPSAIAQSTPLPAGLQKQLDRIDLAVNVAGYISDSVSGLEQRDANDGSVVTTTGTSTTGFVTTTTTATATTSGITLRIKPSNTVSELGTLRYTARPYLGFEFNFGNSRYTENTLFTSTTKTTTTTVVTPPTPPTTTTTNTTTTNFPSILPGGVQNNVHELTLGYVVHPHKIWGIQPFLGAGGGTLQFRPTPGGGQGLPRQWRAVYYYTAGLEDNFPGSDHFGVRLGFRQLIYLAPDFGQNYLTITRRERTSEPTFGFYARF